MALRIVDYLPSFGATAPPGIQFAQAGPPSRTDAGASPHALDLARQFTALDEFIESLQFAEKLAQADEKDRGTIERDVLRHRRVLAGQLIDEAHELAARRTPQPDDYHLVKFSDAIDKGAPAKFEADTRNQALVDTGLREEQLQSMLRHGRGSSRVPDMPTVCREFLLVNVPALEVPKERALFSDTSSAAGPKDAGAKGGKGKAGQRGSDPFLGISRGSAPAPAPKPTDHTGDASATSLPRLTEARLTKIFGAAREFDRGITSRVKLKQAMLGNLPGINVKELCDSLSTAANVEGVAPVKITPSHAQDLMNHLADQRIAPSADPFGGVRKEKRPVAGAPDLSAGAAEAALPRAESPPASGANKAGEQAKEGAAPAKPDRARATRAHTAPTETAGSANAGAMTAGDEEVQRMKASTSAPPNATAVAKVLVSVGIKDAKMLKGVFTHGNVAPVIEALGQQGIHLSVTDIADMAKNLRATQAGFDAAASGATTSEAAVAAERAAKAPPKTRKP